uniref:Uncharacterized protein n=1 Tax=Heterorhabditis bacteriophora TaxID=37862 RepID=A0A1I7WZA8_HETBA
MAFLKSALHILDLVERAEYKDALEFIDSSSQDPHGLLFSFILFLLKYVFYTPKDLFSSREYSKVVGSAIFGFYHLYWGAVHFNFPEFWRKLCDELPQRLERRICERIMCDDEELQHPIEEAAYVMIFFDSIEPRVDYKFSKLLKAVLDEIDPTDRAAFPFLTRLARIQPFSPTLGAKKYYKKMFLLS